MGMEGYSILLTAREVQIIHRGSCWRLEGKSNYYSNDLNKILKEMNMDNTDDEEWVFDRCLELRIHSKDNYLQGIEMRGCLSHLEEGIRSCYEIIKQIDKKVVPVDIYILNERVKIASFTELYQVICEGYKDKIDIFKERYKDIKLKVTCKEFYKEVEKRNRWYYRVFSKMMDR